MLEQVVIRSVRYSHPDAVALTAVAQSYYVTLYGGPDETPVTDDEFAPPLGDFLVLYLPGPDGEQAVAMGGWRFHPTPVGTSRRPAELKRMFVADGHRGRGLARRTLAALEASALTAGADWLVLETGTPQVDALGLYRSSGYREVEAFGHYAGSESSVTLGKPLVV